MAKNRVFITKSPLLALAKNPLFKAYTAALELFWQGENRACIEHLSLALQQNSAQRFALPLYRLWVEVLAVENDHSALELLSRHLKRLPWSEDNQLASYALRGLIHLERDEIEGAELIFSTVKRHPNSYVRELGLKLAWRKGAGLPEAELLHELLSPTLGDYLHWKELARSYSRGARLQQLEALLPEITQRFPRAPLEPRFNAHRLIEAGKFKQALPHSLKLLQEYPQQADFQVLHAYILLNLGKSKAAARLLEQAIQAGNKQDPDIFALLSYAYRQLDQRSRSHEKWQQAFATAEIAEAYYHRLGVSCGGLRLPFQERQALPADNTSNLLHFAASAQSINAWMIEVPPRAYIPLLDSPLASISHRKQRLSSETKVNDLVFLASPHPFNHDQQRILALYFVLGSAGSLIDERNVFNLKLVKRFSTPLAVALPASHMQALAPLKQAQLELINQELETSLFEGENDLLLAKDF